MKIFITGATGYVGQNLVRSSIKKGAVVHILTRKELHIFSGNKKVQVMVGDINDPITLPVGIDTIYHCAGVIHGPERTLEEVNVVGTQHVVNVALRHDCKLIYLSSAGVAGITDNTIVDEKTPCHPHNNYEVSKYKAEQIILKSIKEDGLKAVIVRPTTIFGTQKRPEDSFFQLLRAMRTGKYRNIGKGVYNIVHVDEVIHALELLGDTDACFGEIYIINTPITYKDMDILVKNIPPIVMQKTKNLPYVIAIFISLLLSVLYLFSKRKNPLTISRVKSLANQQIYSQEKIVKKLSFTNEFPVEEYLRKVCREYIDQGDLT